jgi:hypothetical protein
MAFYFVRTVSKVLQIIFVIIVAAFIWESFTKKQASSKVNIFPSPSTSHDSSISPFVVDTSKRPWCRTTKCPRDGEPELMSLHWRYAKARWEIRTDESNDDPIRIHGARIRASSSTTFEMTNGRSIVVLSNIKKSSELRSFRPASRIVLASCLWPKGTFPRNGSNPFICRRLPANSSRNYLEGFGPCLFAQDYFAPELFQHAMINSVPTNFIATTVRRFLLPNAVLVGRDAAQVEISHERWQKWDETQCGKEFLNDTLREWIFIGTGEKSHASHDCYPIGTFDQLRDDLAGETPRVDDRNLLVFASRDNGTGSGSRMPRFQDTVALEDWLSNHLASELRLSFVKLYYNAHPHEMRDAFRRARVVFAPHGGALANLVYSHESTIVVEFQPANGMRLCFACMAYAMRFPVYVVYVPEGKGGWSKDIKTKVLYDFDVPDFKDFWYSRVQALFNASDKRL